MRSLPAHMRTRPLIDRILWSMVVSSLGTLFCLAVPGMPKPWAGYGVVRAIKAGPQFLTVERVIKPGRIQLHVERDN